MQSLFLVKENDENINPHSTRIMLKRNTKILRSQYPNNKTECKNIKVSYLLNTVNTVIQNSNTTNNERPVCNQFGMYFY